MYPRTFKEPKEMKKLIDEYFEITPVEDITITGLCLHLNIVKDTFYAYNKRKEFKGIVSLARQRVENAYEISLRRHGRAGDIFALKNFGWSDKQEIQHTQGAIPVVIKDDSEESS